MIVIKRYKSDLEGSWNDFIEKVSAPFLFNRNYLEYHSHKYHELSFMVFQDNEVIGLFPATINQQEVNSHGWLTYGGLIREGFLKSEKILEIYKSLISEYKSLGFLNIKIKLVPGFYNEMISQGDEYALFNLNFNLSSRNLSSGIYLKTAEFPKKKLRDSRKAEQCKFLVGDVGRLDEIFKAINQNLRDKFGVTAVHTALEMQILMTRFPSNIAVYELRDVQASLCAAAIVYHVNAVAHVQYMIATELGKSIRALDRLIFHIFELYKGKGYDWLEFGISTTGDGKDWNSSLTRKKEEFGARSLCYDSYTLVL